MSSNDRRRKKNERRQRRLEKRERKKAAHDAKLDAVRCMNCGELFGLADDEDVVHRPGPCDATPETIADMEAFLAAREEEYALAPGGKIACKSCGVLHGEDRQATYFFEGRLVWDGCESCEKSGTLGMIREAFRERWFGVNFKLPGGDVGKGAVDKYVPTAAR